MAGSLRALSRRTRVRVLVGLVVALVTAGLISITGQSEAEASEWWPVPASRVYTVDGHGYGHGHGMSQWGSQGAAMSGLNASQIMDFYYPGTTQVQIGAPNVRVLLTAISSSDIRVDGTNGSTVMAIRDDASGTLVYAPSGYYRVITSGNTQRLMRFDGTWQDYSIGGSGVYAGPMTFWTGDGATVWSSGSSARNYRGAISVVRTGGATSTAVNTVNMQEYLQGVVPRESPPSFQPAALQAQSIAARSYAWWDAQTPSASYYDICDTTACQVYGGRSVYSTSGGWKSEEWASTNDAVAATGGVALYYNGAPAFTQFSASNGGVMSAGSQPYLVDKNDPYDGIPSGNPNHNWSSTLSADTVEAAYPSIGTLQGLRVMSRSGLGEWGGYITSVQLVGSARTVTISSPRFNLKSTYWKPREEGNPYGSLDAVDAVTGDQVRARGWSVDPNWTGPMFVHAYVDGAFRGEFLANASRPDVGAALPSHGDLHGYDITLPVSQGRHDVCIFAINVGAGSMNSPLGCMGVNTSGIPIGNLESSVVSAGRAVLTGWTLDSDAPGPVDVHVYVNGGGAVFTADDPRPDVGAAYPGTGNDHGFSVSVPLPPGTSQVCVYAFNTPAPGINPVLGCRTLTLAVDPVGNLEAVSGGPRAVTAVGWAFDQETLSPIDVHVYIDGAYAATATANLGRADVGAAFPGAGNQHGFSVTVPATPGNRQVCVYAINVLQGSTNSGLGCRTADVGVAPVGRIDEATVTGFRARVAGWALDGDGTQPIDVHLYVDGRFATSVTASDDRPDIGAAFPASGSAHGFRASLDLAGGRHTVCAYGINVLGGKGNPLLSCSTVDVASGQSQPYGTLDEAKVVDGVVQASGWALDPDVPTSPVTVHFYVDGAIYGLLSANSARPDVAAAFPGAGSAHGYTGHLTLARGTHSVCTYAINQGAGTGSSGLGCRTVTVP
jgi:SpoIID/LytB domain protein